MTPKHCVERKKEFRLKEDAEYSESGTPILRHEARERVEEMEFKLNKGLDDLYQKFDAAGINELLDINRKNLCCKLFGLF